LAQNPDLSFLARQWETVELPKEKKYLLRYFDTPIQKAFLKYVHIFGNYSNFVDHTGLSCSTRWLAILYNRLQTLQTLHREARANMDMTALAHIESGNYKL
jgi:hypothetical protein